MAKAEEMNIDTQNFEGAVNKIKELVDGTSALGAALQGQISLFGSVVEAVGAINGKIGAAASGVTSFAARIPALAEGLTSLVGRFLPVGEGINNFGNMLATILPKITSVSALFLQGMGIAAGAGIILAGLGLLQAGFGEQLNGMLEMAMTKGPELITNLCNGIVAALPLLIEQGALLLNNFMLAIIANLPAIIEGGMNIISALITGVATQLPMLIPTAVQVILTLIMALIENLPQLINSGLQLIGGLVEGLVQAIPLIIAAIPGIILGLIGALIQCLPQLIKTGADLLGSLARGLVEALPALVATTPQIIGGLLQAFLDNLPQLLQTGVELLGSLAAGLVEAIPEVLSMAGQVINDLKQTFSEINWGEIGRDIISGLAKGLSNAGGILWDAAKSVASTALDKIKSALGIHSPSRVFRDEVGKMMALGMGIGFETNVPLKQMSAGADEAVSGMKHTAASVTGGVSVPAGLTEVTPGAGDTFGRDNKEELGNTISEALVKAMEGIGVYMDSKPVGKLVTPVIDAELGRLERRLT